MIYKFLRPIILIQNLPFLLILSIYVTYNIFKHTNIIEMEMLTDEDIKKSSVAEWVEKVYPKHFRIIVALFFYFLVWFFYFR